MTKSKKIGVIVLIVLAVLVALYLFLIFPRVISRPDLSTLSETAFAHRGYFDNENGVPENSLAAFSLAIEHGYGIELDVQPSADGVPMVFHDKDLERVCGVSGSIWDYTAAELGQMSLLGTEETIPTLAEVLALIDGQVPLLVEYKLDRVDTQICVDTQAQLDDYAGEYFIQAFHPLALMWYRKNAPEVPRGQLMQDYMQQEDYAGDPIYWLLGHMVADVVTRPDFIAFRHDDDFNLSINLCRLLGTPVLCWTIEDEAAYQTALERYDGVIFNSKHFAP